MALFRLSLVFSLLLLSLLVIASADDYSKYDSSKYGYDGISSDSPQAKPEDEEKSHYDTKPVNYNRSKPSENEKPDYGKKPEEVKPKPEGEEKPHYDNKEYTYKPKPEEKEKEEKKPEAYYKQKPEKEEKPYYYKAEKPEEKPEVEVENKDYHYQPHPEGEEEIHSIGVQGLVLCKSGSKHYPIHGAVAKLTCKTVDEVGIEKSVSVCDGTTDEKGYFLATLSNYGHGLTDKLKLKDCKAYLQSSSLQTCKFPSNVNKGIEGAPLPAKFDFLKEKRMNLYSIGPFFYTPEAESATPAGGY